MKIAALLLLALPPLVRARACEYDWTEGSVMAPCGPGDVLATLPAALSPAECFAECEALEACRSFRVRADACVLLTCRPAGRRRGPASFGVLRDCRTPAPSAPPTAAPSAPPPAGPWSSPSGIPRSAPVRWEAFYVPALQTSCEVLRPARGARSIVFANWGGDAEDCARECAYDSRCGGFLYSNATRACTKAAALESADVLSPAPPVLAYAKAGSPVAHWSGLCSGAETREACEALAPRCDWKRGPRGVNQVKVMFDGWCGRVEC